MAGAVGGRDRIDAVLAVEIRNFVRAGGVETSATGVGGTLNGRQEVGLESGELEIAAAVEGEFDDLALLDDAADFGVVGVDQRSPRFDFNRLSDGTDFEADIDTNVLAGFEDDLVDDLAAEAFAFGG